MKKWTALCLVVPLLLSLVLFSGCVTTITVSPHEGCVYVGEEVTFSVKKGDMPFTQAGWRLDGDDVGYLKNDSGSSVVVKTDAPGRATITAFNSLSQDGKPEDSAILIVKQKPAIIEVLPTHVSMKEGDSRVFTAIVRDEAGKVITGLSPNWVVTTTSGNSIGVVSPPSGSTTTFTAAKYGTGRLKAVIDTASPSAVKLNALPAAVITSNEVIIEVTYDPVLTTVDVAPSSWSMQEGSTRDFTATGYDQKGNVMQDFSPIWSTSTSSGEGIGTFSPGAGQSTTFTAVSAGSGKLIAAQGSKSGYADITVTYTPVLTRMTINPTSKTITHGDSQLFTVVGYDQKGKVMSVSPTWSLTGDIDGKATFTPTSGASSTLTAGDPGAAPVTGKFRAEQGNVSVEADVTINEYIPILTLMTISLTSKTMTHGDSQLFTVVGYDQNGKVMNVNPTWSLTGGIIGKVTFTPTSGTSSTLTAGDPGAVPVTGKFRAEQGSILVEADVTIQRQARVLTSIGVSLSSTSVDIDSSVTCTASGIDQYGDSINVNPTWSIGGGPSGLFNPTIGQSTVFTATLVGDGSGNIIASDGISGSAPISVASLQGVADYYANGTIFPNGLIGTGTIGATIPLRCSNPAPQGAIITGTSCSFSGSDDSRIVYVVTREGDQLLRLKVWPPSSVIIIMVYPSIVIDPFPGLTANREFYLEFHDNSGFPSWQTFIFQCLFKVYWRKG